MKSLSFVWKSLCVAGMLMGHSDAHAEPLEPTGWLIPKQIAAPPEDFLSGMVRLPAPASLGRESGSAVLPVTFSLRDDGRHLWEAVVPIWEAADLQLMLVSPDAAKWKLDVTTPDAKTLPMSDTSVPAGVVRTVDEKGIYYSVLGQRSGEWTFRISSPELASTFGKHNLLIADRAPYKAYTHLKTFDLVVGKKISFVTSLKQVNPQEDLDKKPVRIEEGGSSVAMRVSLPNGAIAVVPMTDDGVGEDTRRGDSLFTGSLQATMPGEYLVQVVFDAKTPSGQRVLRTSQHLLAVSPSGAELGIAAHAAESDDHALQVDIPVRGVDWTDRLKVSTEVWGRGAGGASVPVCWLSGIVRNDPESRSASASLRLDKRWITRAKAAPPFELRNTRVQDPVTNVPLVRAITLPVLMGKLDLSGIPNDDPIDEVMLSGNIGTSERLTLQVPAVESRSARAFGAHNLMLIHGYCSQFPLWPVSDFDGFLELFQDPGQNRGHDEFAQLMLSLGNMSKSFGVVAHSQGGAAALHLYTYYWSGLDWATGSRLIQSVGTPYQGTPLASDIAFLGEIFGSGCGANFDLTPEGSALWLAGIPSSARARVYYWTTSFEDGFGFDFCNFVTDFLLTDPDDGVVEQSRGQLPGANNMGHTEGQCHTTGMRDPAQYFDVGRNIEMNSNAAR